MVENKREFRRQEEGEPYFCFESDLTPIQIREELMSYDEERYDCGNYFLTEKECADAARVVSLWLQMKRFADEHNERKIDFDNGLFDKYYIFYDSNYSCIKINGRATWKEIFQIYFASEETAQKAIDKFHDELMWYFTEYGKDS